MGDCMYERFGLVLMVTHACNLRCSYCYTGAKTQRSMSYETGKQAIVRATRSLQPHGELELGFFGGEPLLEADLILRLLEGAEEITANTNRQLSVSLTTNAAINGPHAWQILTHPKMSLSISHDGLPEIHDRHRRNLANKATSSKVLNAAQRLLEADQQLNVVMVVRPDTVSALPDGIEHLQKHGLRHFTPSLDLWSQWDAAAADRLEKAIIQCGKLWSKGLPDLSISWFDEKLAKLSDVSTTPTARCGFGNGEIAVAPSGTLYPCERLIGEDQPDAQLHLGHVLDGEDFCGPPPEAPPREDSCTSCTLLESCSTTCRCSNYVRTGDVNRPDGLLCLLDRFCTREAVRVAKRFETANFISENL